MDQPINRLTFGPLGSNSNIVGLHFLAEIGTQNIGTGFQVLRIDTLPRVGNIKLSIYASFSMRKMYQEFPGSQSKDTFASSPEDHECRDAHSGSNNSETRQKGNLKKKKKKKKYNA